MLNTKQCKICQIEKSLTDFDCYDGVYRLHCKMCRKEKDRVAAEKRRREKGIDPIKNTESVCIDCGGQYIKKVKHTTRCKPCAQELILQRARVASLKKSRVRGNRIMGSEQKCKHCSVSFLLDRPKSKYCVPCKVLQKKGALPFMKERSKIYAKKYMEIPINREKALDTSYAYVKNKRKNNPLFALSGRIRARLNESLRKNGYTKRSKTHEIIGCSWEFLKGYIERQFPKGMTWENRSEWHIDHIMPLASAKTEQDVVELNHYTNLRPLWAHENLAKSAKVEYLL